MRTFLLRSAVSVAGIMLCASLCFAVDAKKPAAPKAVPEKAATDPKSAADAKQSAKKELIDINSASEAELKAISGIGDAYAAKIVAGRPYANKTQLKSRSIIPGPLYEQIKDQVIAKQAKKEDKAASKADAKPVAKDEKKKK